ncbi:MAG: hypothetical protein EBV31_03375 [Verrucomicrobia bacterium]|nr:hypothetical protein [Verrucomicrobiota bacterium]
MRAPGRALSAGISAWAATASSEKSGCSVGMMRMIFFGSTWSAWLMVTTKSPLSVRPCSEFIQ